MDNASDDPLINGGSRGEKIEPGSRATWPPNCAWHFRENEVAYLGRRFMLNGQSWKLLQRLAMSTNGSPDGTVSANDLLAVLDPSGFMSVGTLRTHLSLLRTFLRREFKVHPSNNPIPCVSGESGTAWMLDTSCFSSDE